MLLHARGVRNWGPAHREEHPLPSHPTDRPILQALRRAARVCATTQRDLKARPPSDPLRRRLLDAFRPVAPHATDAERLDASAQLAAFLPLALSLHEGAPTVMHIPVAPALRPLRAAVAELAHTCPPSQSVRATHPDPLVHLYEPFLASLSPSTRRRTGVFYTPPQVVDAVLGQVDHALRTRLGLTDGLFDDAPWRAVARGLGRPVPAGIDPDQPFVRIIDPAVGTGAFLAGVLRRARQHWELLQEHGSEPSWSEFVSSRVIPRLCGVDCSVTALVVAHIRLALDVPLSGAGAGSSLHEVFPLIHANTLAHPLVLGDAVYSVVIGNPPFARESAGSRGGGWIRSGHPSWRGGRAPLEDYLDPVRALGGGGHLKSLYNLYTWFWRWSCWQAFERTGGPGVVGLVTASSFLRGPGFAGMRSHLRSVVDGLDILDLEGDTRGPVPTENVFDITTPVCITVGWRGAPTQTVPRQARIQGSRDEKLRRCAELGQNPDAVAWTPLPHFGRTAPQDPGSSDSAGGVPWPSLVALFPWQHSGVQYKRTWPIATSPEVLIARWRALLAHDDRAAAFRTTAARPLNFEPRGSHAVPALSRLEAGAPHPPIRPYGHRSFDRRYAFVDVRLCDRLRPALWAAHSERQVYLTSLLTGRIGAGPAVTLSSHVPDLHHFRGSYGGRDVVPLWRDAAATRPNVAPGVLEALSEVLDRPVTPEDLFAYCVALLAQPAFVERCAGSIRSQGLCVPLTADPNRLGEGLSLGRQLVFLQTFGDRFPPHPGARLSVGRARERLTIPRTPGAIPTAWHHDPATGRLHVGAGGVGPVSPDIMDWRVSGLPVVAHWLDSRIGTGRGRRSSPLDHIRPQRWTDGMVQELLELLWVLEGTLALLPTLERWLDGVLSGPLLPLPTLPGPRAVQTD